MCETLWGERGVAGRPYRPVILSGEEEEECAETDLASPLGWAGRMTWGYDISPNLGNAQANQRTAN